MGIFSLGYGFFTYFRGGGRILKLGLNGESTST